MADNDVQVDLKKRARRRLVGAAALALVAVIVLPMVMDNAPREAGAELQIRIPSQEGSNFASRLITGAAPTPAKPVLPAQSEPSVTVAEAPAAKMSSALTEEKIALPSVASEPLAKTESLPKAAQLSAPSSDAQRARDILNAKAATHEAASEKYFVQLGVFRDEGNAREVLTRATSIGVKAMLQKVDTKSRVRAGPFSDRAAADAVVAKLKKSGLNGIVTRK